MKALDFRNLTREELLARLAELQNQYFSTAERVRTGKEKNHQLLVGLRRDVARAKTVLQEDKKA